MKYNICIILSLLLIGSICNYVYGQEFTFNKGNEGVELLYGDKSCYFYQIKEKTKDSQYPRSNYIHPLYNLSGDIITEDFPKDHMHQRGIFWTWHQVFVNNIRVADPWLCEGMRWKFDTVFTSFEKNSAILHASLYWVVTSKNMFTGKEIVKEDVTIKYTLIEDEIEVDFKISLLALMDNIKIGGSEDVKGYGGFSTRIKLYQNQVVTSDSGILIPEQLPMNIGGWVNFQQNSISDTLKKSNILIMCEPKKLPSFQGWILRSKNSMQNPAFPGAEPMLVSNTKPLIFRNKIILYEKSISNKKINKLYLDFLGN